MPVYEYCCAECEETFELLVRSVTQPESPTCPTCGSSDVRKSVSLFAVSGAGGGRRAGAGSCDTGPT